MIKSGKILICICWWVQVRRVSVSSWITCAKPRGTTRVVLLSLCLLHCWRAVWMISIHIHTLPCADVRLLCWQRQRVLWNDLSHSLWLLIIAEDDLLMERLQTADGSLKNPHKRLYHHRTCEALHPHWGCCSSETPDGEEFRWMKHRRRHTRMLKLLTLDDNNSLMSKIHSILLNVM